MPLEKGDKYMKGSVGNLTFLVFDSESDNENAPDKTLFVSNENSDGMVELTGLWVNEKQ